MALKMIWMWEEIQMTQDIGRITGDSSKEASKDYRTCRSAKWTSSTHRIWSRRMPIASSADSDRHAQEIDTKI
jgi:hypothetical protein